VEYWLIETGPQGTPGIDGGLLRRRGAAPAEGQPVNAFVCSIDSPSVDEAARAIQAHGGTIVLPRMAVPGVGWLIYARDTEGNLFGVFQEDRAAA
jgi:predicted enzyme related to lactoylglutathione lyase